jgi:type IV pilus assembly protein PilW
MRLPIPHPRRRAPALSSGFSLPELLVAVVIGLLILAGMTTLFVGNSRTQARVERANRQIENGRYAIDLLTTDLRNAGFYGEYDPTELADPPALPDPCAATLDALRAALPLHVQGYPSSAARPSCLSDVKAGTDVLVVRHTRACVVGDPNCGASDADGPLFQASLCASQSEAGSGNKADHYALDTVTANLNRHQRDCTSTPGSGTLAPMRRFLTHIYFVANNDQSGDGIPTLKRAELRLVDGNLAFTIVPLAEGVDNLQFEYGIDSDGDGAIDQYTGAPAAVADWRRALSVRIGLAARNTEAGNNERKHAFQSTVLMPNPAGRKQS